MNKNLGDEENNRLMEFGSQSIKYQKDKYLQWLATIPKVWVEKWVIHWITSYYKNESKNSCLSLYQKISLPNKKISRISLLQEARRISPSSRNGVLIKEQRIKQTHPKKQKMCESPAPFFRHFYPVLRIQFKGKYRKTMEAFGRQVNLN